MIMAALVGTFGNGTVDALSESDFATRHCNAESEAHGNVNRLPTVLHLMGGADLGWSWAALAGPQ